MGLSGEMLGYLPAVSSSTYLVLLGGPCTLGGHTWLAGEARYAVGEFGRRNLVSIATGVMVGISELLSAGVLIWMYCGVSAMRRCPPAGGP